MSGKRTCLIMAALEAMALHGCVDGRAPLEPLGSVREVAVANNGAPAAASSLNAAPWGSRGVWLKWTDNATNESGVRVEKSSDGGASWVAIGTAVSDDSNFIDQHVSPEQTVCYHVLMFNSSGDAPPSNISCTAPPLGATELTGTLIDATWSEGWGVTWTTIELRWRDNSNVEDGYVIYSYDELPVARLDATSTSFRYTSPEAGWSFDGLMFWVGPTRDDGVGDWTTLWCPAFYGECFTDYSPGPLEARVPITNSLLLGRGAPAPSSIGIHRSGAHP